MFEWLELILSALALLLFVGAPLAWSASLLEWWQAGAGLFAGILCFVQLARDRVVPYNQPDVYSNGQWTRR